MFEDVIASVLRGEGGKRKLSQAAAGCGTMPAATRELTSLSLFQLVDDLMKEKARAEIIVRHSNGLRGILTGYVRRQIAI